MAQPKAKRRRVRDERQQMLNKLAQIRCARHLVLRTGPCVHVMLYAARWLHRTAPRPLSIAGFVDPVHKAHLLWCRQVPMAGHAF